MILKNLYKLQTQTLFYNEKIRVDSDISDPPGFFFYYSLMYMLTHYFMFLSASSHLYHIGKSSHSFFKPSGYS